MYELFTPLNQRLWRTSGRPSGLKLNPLGKTSVRGSQSSTAPLHVSHEFVFELPHSFQLFG